MNSSTNSEPPSFDLRFEAAAGVLVEVSPLVRRMVRPNPSPFTFRGTNTYVVGRGRVAVIDPGPDDPGAVETLLAALASETVTQIVVTHTHRDHSPAARPLAAATGAQIIGCARHRAARALSAGEAPKLDAANDTDYAPDRELVDGEAFEGEGFTLTALETPGHTMNHLAFHLAEENALFSGDHVMAWSTSIVAPPDGSMSAYMASLEKLRGRADSVYWPGHGGPVKEPERYVRALIGHRRQREAGILARLAEGERTIPEIVELNYAGLDPRLKGAAALSTFAHVEDLAQRGLVATDGPPTLTGRYRRA